MRQDICPINRNIGGNIFTALLAGVAITAVLTMTLYRKMSGPLATMVQVSNQSAVETQMRISGGVVVASTLRSGVAGGDCDSDLLVEPPEWVSGTIVPVGGGLIPTTLGLPVTDPWGSGYGYCVWDVGTFNDPSINNGCGAGANRLSGSGDPSAGNEVSQTVLAIISAGADRVFQTTCSDYTNGTTDVISVASGSDDIIKRLTYVGALDSVGGWVLSDGDTETVENSHDVDVSAGNFTASAMTATSVTASGRVIAGDGLLLGNQSSVTDVDCVSSGDFGLLRYNTTGSGVVQFCNGSNNWLGLGNGFVSFARGLLTAPGLAVGGDSDTGLWRPLTNTLSFVAWRGEVFRFNTVASGVNYFEATSASTGEAPVLSSAGTDTDIDMVIDPKGAGSVAVSGQVLVESGVGVGVDVAACSASNAGALRYDTSSLVMKYCNGAFWYTITDVLNPDDYVSPGASVSNSEYFFGSYPAINMTSFGAIDWAIWNLDGDATTVNQRKSTGGSQISASLFGGANDTHTSSLCLLQPGRSWTDGTPTAAGSTGCVLRVTNPPQNSGVTVSVPADSTERTVRLYLGMGLSDMQLSATFSNNDTGTPDWIGSVISYPATNNVLEIYDLTYSNPEPNQTLNISWTMSSATGYYSLMGAALQ